VHRRTFLATLAATGVGLRLGFNPLAAFAGRFGVPWQARVSVDQTVVYTGADRASAPVGPLVRGTLVAVLEDLNGADGAEWNRMPDGYILASDLTEEFGPWVAEVVVPSVPIYAYPDGHSAIRHSARQGSLLRTAGMAKGINGDKSPWWSTTEGYVSVGSLAESDTDWAKGWTIPDASEATQGWWGAVRSQANVRVGNTTDAPVVGALLGGERVKVLEEADGQRIGASGTWYRIDGGRYAGAWVHNSLVSKIQPAKSNTTAPAAGSPAGPWIVVERSAASLTLVGGDGQPMFTTYVSLGRAGVITPTGQYSTMGKYRADEMTSASVDNPDHQYDLPNVPYTQYYKEGGYAIHGTYWHDEFGSVQSQGCINVTWTDGAYLFSQTVPVVADGDLARWAVNQPATPVVILD
jgi:hypothetical protein